MFQPSAGSRRESNPDRSREMGGGQFEKRTNRRPDRVDMNDQGRLSIRREIRANTSSNISSVRRPVKVFCWEGW